MIKRLFQRLSLIGAHGHSYPVLICTPNLKRGRIVSGNLIIVKNLGNCEYLVKRWNKT